MNRRGLCNDLEVPNLGISGEALDLLLEGMSDFREIQRERAKESQIHGFCPPQMIQRERSFDTLESMREDNDSDSDDDMHFSQEGFADVLREHESWMDDDDEKFETNSAHSTPKFRAESPPTWLDDEDTRITLDEGEISIPELRLSAGTPSEEAPSEQAPSLVTPTPTQAPSNKRVRGESSLVGPSKRQKVKPQTHYNPDQKDATKAELIPFIRWMLDGEGNKGSLKARYMQRNGLTEEEWNVEAKPFLEGLGEKVDATPLPASDDEVEDKRDIDRKEDREYVYLRMPMAGKPDGRKSTYTPTFGGGYTRKLSIREAAWIRDIIRPFAEAMKEYVEELGKCWVPPTRRASAQHRQGQRKIQGRRIVFLD
eukprot:g100.t1